METVLTTVLTPIVRHGMTTAGGALVTIGLVDPSMQGHFATIATGIVLGGIGMAWSLLKNKKK